MSDGLASTSGRPVKLASGDGIRLLAGLAAVFAFFQLLGYVLGSDRGQSGVLIAAAVVSALLAVECGQFRLTPAAALQQLGLGWPTAAGIFGALVVCLLLLAVIPVYAALRGASLTTYLGWPWLLPGLFAQAGIAEETLFRGYLFGQLRQGRGFWHAAAVATAPFVVVHLILFAIMPGRSPWLPCCCL
jgi:membrane protease YdiL (CAAX protease family)